MFCNKCGNKLVEGSKFCNNCGNEISNTVNTTLSGENNVSNTEVSSKRKIDLKKFFSNIKFDVNKALISLIVVFVIMIGFVVGYKITHNEKSRTIMIYMVGSNLESEGGLGTRDLKDLDYNITSSNKVKVLLMAGGTKSWKNDYINANETSIYELTEYGIVPVKQQDKKNMGEFSNLAYFLTYVYDNYKTDEYDLLFWNHGGAVDGSEYDDLFNDNLKLSEMTKALEESPFNEKNKLEVVSFRTCLNATIEVANVFKNYSKYLVASEEVTIGSQFDSALRFINDIKATDSGIDVGNKDIQNYKETVTNFCNFYESDSKEENYCVKLTYSLVDLSKISKLNDSINSFSLNLNKNLSSNFNDISKIRASLNQYADDDKGYDMVDLYDLVEKLSSFSKNEATDVLEKIKDAVIYTYSNDDYSHGLSVYFPFYDSYFLKSYPSFDMADNYKNLITNFNSLKNSANNQSFSSFSSMKGNITKKTKDKANFEIKLTDEQAKEFANASYYIFVDTKDGYQQFLYYGRDVTLKDNSLKAHVEGKMLRFSDSEYDDENCWISVVEKEVTDDYVDVYAFPLLTRGWKIDGATLTIRIDKEHPNGHVISAVSNDSNNSKNNSNSSFGLALLSNNGVNINDYNFIEFASQRYKIIDDNGNFNQNYLSNGNNVYRGMYLPVNEFRFIKEDFDSDYDYYAVFHIWDTSGKDYYSNIVKMN